MGLMDPLAGDRRRAGAAWFYTLGPGSALTPAAIDAMPESVARELATRMRADLATLVPPVLDNVALRGLDLHGESVLAMDRSFGRPFTASTFLAASAVLGTLRCRLGSGWAGGAGLLAWIVSLGTDTPLVRVIATETGRASAAALTYEFFRGTVRAQLPVDHA